jgi:hypothetical protein
MLANDMAQDFILFQCDMVHAGQTCTEATMYVADGRQTGRVIMCTFPGFSKKIQQEGKVLLIPVVKANVELESAFQSKS